MKDQNSRRSSRERRRAPLSNHLEKGLMAYASAATAAGFGLLTLAGSAEARVVYTPANSPIPVNGTLSLDLNHDGVVDFRFSNWRRETSHFLEFLLHVLPQDKSNAVWGRGTMGSSRFNFSGNFAVALRSGFTVGPSRSYFEKNRDGIMGRYVAEHYSAASSKTYGQWLNTKNRYLGLQFLIDGKIHYGWARVNVTKPGQVGIRATLTGYAYQTIPNKPILAGQTMGPHTGTLEPISLGHLAQGAAGLSSARK
jgi:hypothetical protein